MDLATAGDYGSMVNERVGTGEWEDGSELGDTWASRNAFSYGRSVTTFLAFLPADYVTTPGLSISLNAFD